MIIYQLKPMKVYSNVENEVINREKEIKKLKNKIIKNELFLDRLDRSMEKLLDELSQEILKLFYIENEPWFKIAEEVSLSIRHCKRIRSKAINELIPALY